jgi:hypothetical protein
MSLSRLIVARVTPSRLLHDTAGQPAAVIDSAGRLFRVVPEDQLLDVETTRPRPPSEEEQRAAGKRFFEPPAARKRRLRQEAAEAEAEDLTPPKPRAGGAP